MYVHFPILGRRRKGSFKKHKFPKGNSFYKVHKDDQNQEDNPDILSSTLKEVYTWVPRDIEEKRPVEGSHPLGSLRPSPPTQESQVISIQLQQRNVQCSTLEMVGNRMINMPLLAGMLTKVYADHITQSSDCIPDFTFPSEQEQVQGLDTSVVVYCKIVISSLNDSGSTRSYHQEKEADPL